MSIAQRERKIKLQKKLLKKTRPFLKDVKIIVRKDRFFDDDDLDVQLQQIASELDGNHYFVRRKVEKKIGYRTSRTRFEVPVGYVERIALFDPSTAYEYRVVEHLYDHKHKFVRLYDVLSDHAIIKADNITEFVRDPTPPYYPRLIDPLGRHKHIYIHSITSFPIFGLSELMDMSNTTIYLVFDEGALDGITDIEIIMWKWRIQDRFDQRW